jgi:hypothetical protein
MNDQYANGEDQGAPQAGGEGDYTIEIKVSGGKITVGVETGSDMPPEMAEEGGEAMGQPVPSAQEAAALVKQIIDNGGKMGEMDRASIAKQVFGGMVDDGGPGELARKPSGERY